MRDVVAWRRTILRRAGIVAAFLFIVQFFLSVPIGIGLGNGGSDAFDTLPEVWLAVNLFALVIGASIALIVLILWFTWEMLREIW